MESFYDFIVELGKSHVKFKNGGYTDLLKFDLKNKRIWNGNIVLYDEQKGGIQVDEIHTVIKSYKGLKSLPLLTRQLNMDELYTDYLYSIPTDYSRYMTSNFRAKLSDELTERQLLDGKNRGETRHALEAYVMFSDLKKLFTGNNFFFKGESGLVLFRDWI